MHIKLQSSESNMINLKDLTKKHKINKITPIITSKWVDQKSFHFNKLTLIDNKIIAKGRAHVFGKRKIKDEDSFTITISRIHKFIDIGIVDSNYC